MIDSVRTGLCVRTGAVMTALLSMATLASALTIETRFFEPGSIIPSVGFAEEEPSTAVGGGDLPTIFRAAADVWEAMIPDDHRLTLNFGWSNTSLVSNAAYHVKGAAGGQPFRQITGSIAFNSDATNPLEMFLDPTPTLNEEFAFDSRLFTDLGAGPVETSRRFMATSSVAKGRIDLYTTALHEIGHALGLTNFDYFVNEVADGKIDITSGPYAGTDVPVEHTHLEVPGALMSSNRMTGERRGITQVDLLSTCQASRFTGCDYTLEPATFAGDLNGDGLTNAADYTLWRDNQPSTALRTLVAEPSAGFDLWAGNFGRSFQLASTFSGDFNGDGAVNAADYSAWRDATNAGDLTADGNGDGRVTAADQQVWASSFEYHTPLLAGDYNGDGLVNAADYTVWRDSSEAGELGGDGDGDRRVTKADYRLWADHHGNSMERLAGDFNGDGLVNAADYTAWRDADARGQTLTGGDLDSWAGNYGASVARGGNRVVLGAMAPEPAACFVLATGWVLAATRRPAATGRPV